MAWEQSSSASFAARHASADAAGVRRMLASLEQMRMRLSQTFPRLPGEMTIVVHGRPPELVLSNPLIALAWLTSEPTSRRYVCGWSGRRELHVLSPEGLAQRAAGGRDSPPGSREMLRLSAAALYARRVIDENAGAADGRRFGPSRPLVVARRELRWAWLLEGGARWLSGQTAHARPAIARRLREGRRPAFPPAARDAPLLGGTVLDLLAAREGPAAVDALLLRRPTGDPLALVARAFAARPDNVDAEWRTHLARLSAAAG